MKKCTSCSVLDKELAVEGVIHLCSQVRPGKALPTQRRYFVGQVLQSKRRASFFSFILIWEVLKNKVNNNKICTCKGLKRVNKVLIKGYGWSRMIWRVNRCLSVTCFLMFSVGQLQLHHINDKHVFGSNEVTTEHVQMFPVV